MTLNNGKDMKSKELLIKINPFICFIVCLMLMIVIPIVNSHKLVGIDLEKEEPENAMSPITHSPDGTMTINTTELGKNIIGFAGPTPVEIKVKDDNIVSVTALENDETPEYMGAVLNSDLLESLNGLPLKKARGTKIDAVTGATYTSNALIENIHTGIYYAFEEEAPGEDEIVGQESETLSFKFFVTIAVILAGAIIPLIFRNKKYRIVQLILNVVILGFWGGTFLSYSLMVSALTNGMWKIALIPAALMLILAFIYPMFGKTDHYCTWICPYGSIQDLASKCCKKKLPLSPRMVKFLTGFREILWFGLMWLLWTGLWFDWMGYEPFAAFFFQEASPVVLGIAGGFLILSFFIPRPYCRFVCPTGSLFKFSEGRR